MNQAIDSWLNNTNLNLVTQIGVLDPFAFLGLGSFLGDSHSPFVFGILCGGILGTSINITSLISLRRLIIQGVPAGIVSYLGSALAETLFLAFINFGSLIIIDSWVTLETGLKLLITIFCFDTVFSFLLDNRLKVVSFDQKFDLFKIFLCNAIIVWSNPGSIGTASALLTSVEGFEFRENTMYLLGIFIGIFVMGLFIGFSVLGITYFWMVKSTKSFRSITYRFNKIISTVILTLLVLSTIYYHANVYVGTSLTTWSNPLTRSPSLISDRSRIRQYQYYLFRHDVDSSKILRKYRLKLRLKKNQSGLFQNIQKSLNKEKKSVDENYLPAYEAMLKARSKKWFSRSQFYFSIKEKISNVFNLKKEKVKFFQDPSFTDLSVLVDMPSPFLFDKTSTRISVRQLTKEEFAELNKIREKRVQELKNSF